MMGLLAFMVSLDPCAGVPDMSTVGTPTVSDDGDCGLFDGLKWSTSLTLTGSLPANAKVQYRYEFSTSSNPDPTNDSWHDWSAFSGSSDTLVVEPISMAGSGWPGPYARNAGETLIGTGYFQIEFRVIGTDGSTVCDDTDGESTTSSTTSVYTCVT